MTLAWSGRSATQLKAARDPNGELRVPSKPREGAAVLLLARMIARFATANGFHLVKAWPDHELGIGPDIAESAGSTRSREGRS